METSHARGLSGAPSSAQRSTATANASWSANQERLTAVAANGGCHSCHSHQTCHDLCPMALNPTASIAGLKRATTAAYLRGDIG